MELTVEPWAIYSVNTRRRSIDPKPAYQRGPVWSVSNQQLFVDSILRGFDIPKLYLRKLNGKEYVWEVIDGQQRLKAIWDFMANVFPIADDADPVNGNQIAGLHFEDLSYELNDLFVAYGLTIVEVRQADDREVEDMFLRLQNGVPLNAPEKRNAISGVVRDFVHETAESSKLMTGSVSFPNSRYSHDEVVAQMLLIEINGGPTSVRHTQLENLYRHSKDFRKTSPRAKHLKRVMNFLLRAFPQQTPELTKVNLLSLYTVASEALTKYSISKSAKEFGNWFVGFEARRRKEEEKPEDERDDRLLSYQMAVIQQTASLASQEARRRILTEDMLASMPNLTLLDDQRQFTFEQRVAIYRNANGQCLNPENNTDCEVECRWDNFHADHIAPHSAGGQTTVANGQLLCPSCNLRKASKVHTN